MMIAITWKFLDQYNAFYLRNYLEDLTHRGAEIATARINIDIVMPRFARFA
jgi:hypothetical protein